MAKSVRILLFMLLTIVLHGIASNTFTKRVEQHNIAIAFPYSHQDRLGVPESPFHPVTDLNSHLHTNQLSVTRVQRVQASEYMFSLKGVLQNCANRESSLSQHWKRLFTTTTSYYCHPVSEYYVFALRHILI